MANKKPRLTFRYTGHDRNLTFHASRTDNRQWHKLYSLDGAKEASQTGAVAMTKDECRSFAKSIGAIAEFIETF